MPRPYTAGSTYSSYAPSFTSTSNKRASLLSVASSLFTKRSDQPLSPAASNSALPDLIEISPQDAEDNERERLREIAARALGIIPTPEFFEPTPQQEPIPTTSAPSRPVDPVPPFPSHRERIPRSAVQISTDSPLQRYYPSVTLRMFKGKGWKPRHLMLTQQPNALWLLHTFRDELEVERLEIVHNSFISVTDEHIGGKKGGVIAVAGRDLSGYDTLTVWHFHMPDPKLAQRWIDQVKSAVLALRTLRESIPLSLSGLSGASFFPPNDTTPTENASRISIAPMSPVGDMDTVLSMRKQGLLQIQSLSPTRSTFSTNTADESEGHRNSNSLSSKASISTHKDREKGAVQALKGLFSSNSPPPQTPHSTGMEGKKPPTRPRSPSAATSIRSFLSSSHQDDGPDERPQRESSLLSGWARATSPTPTTGSNVPTKRLPISGQPGNVATPIIPPIDRRIAEPHYHYPDEPSWSPPTQSPVLPLPSVPVQNDIPDFVHPFANVQVASGNNSAADVLARVNQRASVLAASSRHTGLPPPPRRSFRASNTSVTAPTSFKDEGRRMNVLNSPSLTGLGVTSDSDFAPSLKDTAKDLTFGHSRGQNRHQPPALDTSSSLAIPIPNIPPSSDVVGPMPSLTPPSSAAPSGKSKRFSRQVASIGELPLSKGPPPSVPLPEAPSSSSSTSRSASPVVLRNYSRTVTEEEDEDESLLRSSRGLMPGNASNLRGDSRSPARPASVAISISSCEPPSAERSSSPIDLDQDTEQEEEQEEKKSIVSTLPRFSASKRASTGSGSGQSFGYHSSPASIVNGGGKDRDSLDGNESAGTDSASLASGRDSFGNISLAPSLTRIHRTSMPPPPQKGPAPALPLPPAPGTATPDTARSSMEESWNGSSTHNRLSVISMSSAMSSKRSSVASSFEMVSHVHVQRFRDRNSRLSMVSAPKPPPSGALPAVPTSSAIQPLHVLSNGLPKAPPDGPLAFVPPPIGKRSSSPAGSHSHREGFGVGRQLSKRLRILSAPSSSKASSSSPVTSPTTPTHPELPASAPAQPAPSTPTTSFLQITPVTPTIPIPKVHSASSLAQEAPVETPLSPPPRRLSWGNTRNLSVTADPPPNGRTVEGPPSPGIAPPLSATLPLTPPQVAHVSLKDEGDDKPKSTASSVLSLRVSV
ncbi:hypothetical protein DL96DRAFT_1711995 [Flagelloscypha sp. PMI_526]|nr:hypothetical protein DL96DRAFT_1711995 [Flagelloscypha sp. PMI_526]